MPFNPGTGLEDPNYVPPSMAPPASPVAGGNPLDTEYNNDGTVMSETQKAERGAVEDLGPLGCPPTSASDAPFSEDTIPNGWSRKPTGEEVAYLNKKFPPAEPLAAPKSI